MSLLDYWKKFTNSEDDYDDEAVEDMNDSFDSDSFSSASSSSSYYSYEEDVKEAPRASSRPRRATTASSDPSRVVDVRTTAMLQVVLVKPDKFEDARTIADHLNEKRTVVLNLEAASKEVSRRLVDLLNGVAYANGGQLKKVSSNTYIITPYNVNVSGDLIDELENTGVFF